MPAMSCVSVGLSVFPYPMHTFLSLHRKSGVGGILRLNRLRLFVGSRE